LPIDFKPDFISVKKQSDHSTGGQKSIRVPYGENRSVSETLQQRGNAITLALAYEEQVAVVRVREVPQMSDAKNSRANLFSSDGVIQFSVKRIIPESA
jgi:hypothetical protein